MKSFDKFIRKVLSVGKYHFTSKEAKENLGCSDTSFRVMVKKRVDRKEIVSPARGLYVIIPPEYEIIGSLPAKELVPILFNYWGFPYYVCLLSAAMYHGASHQKPQIFQVMSSHSIPKVKCGKVVINFTYKKNIDNTSTVNFESKTGTLIVSSVEETICDLLTYPKKSGGSNNIATILVELTEEVNVQSLQKIIQKSTKKFWIQRLGYILESIDSDDEEKKKRIIRLLENTIEAIKPKYLPLIPDISIKGAERNRKWKIIINEEIEAD